MILSEIQTDPLNQQEVKSTESFLPVSTNRRKESSNISSETFENKNVTNLQKSNNIIIEKIFILKGVSPQEIEPIEKVSQSVRKEPPITDEEKKSQVIC